MTRRYEYQRHQWQEKVQHVGWVVRGVRPGQVAFCILESLQCRGSPLQHLGPLSQEISQREQHLCTIGQKTVVKIHHAEKTLELFEVLRGWAKFNFGKLGSRGGVQAGLGWSQDRGRGETSGQEGTLRRGRRSCTVPAHWATPKGPNRFPRKCNLLNWWGALGPTCMAV
jgi:hypothetical protein